MAFKTTDHQVVPVQLFIDREGNLYHYFTSSFPEDEAAPLFDWARAAVGIDPGNAGDKEHTLSILIDIPRMTHALLSDDFGTLKPDGRYAGREGKHSADKLQAQLQAALDMLNKVDWEEGAEE